jgi:hypothetical protein
MHRRGGFPSDFFIPTPSSLEPPGHARPTLGTAFERLPEAEFASLARHRVQDQRQLSRRCDQRPRVPAVALEPHSPAFNVRQSFDARARGLIERSSARRRRGAR